MNNQQRIDAGHDTLICSICTSEYWPHQEGCTIDHNGTEANYCGDCMEATEDTMKYIILAENLTSGYVRTLASVHHPKTIEEAREIADRHYATRPDDVITFHPVNGGDTITYAP